MYDISKLKVLGYEETADTKISLQLLELSRESEGLTGRALRKIPFLAHALYLSTDRTTLPKFLRAMHLAVQKHIEESNFQ